MEVRIEPQKLRRQDRHPDNWWDVIRVTVPQGGPGYGQYAGNAFDVTKNSGSTWHDYEE